MPQPDQEVRVFAGQYYDPKGVMLILGMGKAQLDYLVDIGVLNRVTLPGYKRKRFFLKDDVDALKQAIAAAATPADSETEEKMERELTELVKAVVDILAGQGRLEGKIDTVALNVTAVQDDQRKAHRKVMNKLAESSREIKQIRALLQDHEIRIDDHETRITQHDTHIAELEKLILDLRLVEVPASYSERDLQRLSYHLNIFAES